MDKNIFGGGGERRMRGVGSSKKQGQKANGLRKRAMYPPLGWQVESTYKKHWYWRIINYGMRRSCVWGTSLGASQNHYKTYRRRVPRAGVGIGIRLDRIRIAGLDRNGPHSWPGGIFKVVQKSLRRTSLGAHSKAMQIISKLVFRFTHSLLTHYSLTTHSLNRDSKAMENVLSRCVWGTSLTALKCTANHIGFTSRYDGPRLESIRLKPNRGPRKMA